MTITELERPTVIRTPDHKSDSAERERAQHDVGATATRNNVGIEMVSRPNLEGMSYRELRGILSTPESFLAANPDLKSEHDTAYGTLIAAQASGKAEHITPAKNYLAEVKDKLNTVYRLHSEALNRTPEGAYLKAREDYGKALRELNITESPTKEQIEAVNEAEQHMHKAKAEFDADRVPAQPDPALTAKIDTLDNTYGRF